MSHALEFLMRLKTLKKGGAGLPTRKMREKLLAEHLGPAMLAKLNLVHRARKKHGETQ